MAYQKQTWVDGITPLNAEHLNHMEQGISQLSSGGSGLTDDEKTLMLSLFDNAVFNDIDISAALNQLKNLFNGGEPSIYSVTYNLTDVTSDNTADVAKEAFPFTTILTVAEGMEINKSTLSVTMGGVDITDSAYMDGVISIPIVTGDIVIKAEALEEGLIYALRNEVVFDGTNGIDTGIHLFDRYKNFTLVYEFTSSSKTGFVFNEYVDGSSNINNDEFAMQRWGDGNWQIKGFTNSRNNIGVTGNAINMKCVVMLTSKTSGTVYFRNNNGDVTTASFNTTTVDRVVGKTATLGLGRGASGANSGFNGTIHQFKVYERILDEAAINTFMGVN